MNTRLLRTGIAALAGGVALVGLVASSATAAGRTGDRPRGPAAGTVDRVIAAGEELTAREANSLPDPQDVQEPASPGAVVTPDETGSPAEPQCRGAHYRAKGDDAGVAAALMAGRLSFPNFPTWSLPQDPTWRENPYGNTNWVYQFQTLRWADPLRRQGLRTGDPDMLDRYTSLVQDWLRDNPRTGRSAPYAWYDMAVGVRAVGLVCASTVSGTQSWVPAAMQDHAVALLDPAQYRAVGNHGLNQNIGLLAMGCHLDKNLWIDTARSRGETMARAAVDSQGVTDEGSMAYQFLNWVWWTEFNARAHDCGRGGVAESNIARMPSLLAQATQPDLHLVAFGDTDAVANAPSIPGTVSEYASSRGARGPKPGGGLFKAYKRGYAFSRSGWYDTQTAAQQSLMSMRFGPSMSAQVHGHEEGGGIGFYAGGNQLLWQPGQYGGGGGAPRSYVVSNEAHNVIDIPSRPYDRTRGTHLSVTRTSSAVDLISVKSTALKGASWKRTVLHVKGPGFVVVDDRVSQPSNRPVVQRWQLGRDRSIGLGTGRAMTSGAGTNLTVLWAGTRPSVTYVKGQKSPLLGWRSERPNVFQPTPSVQATLASRSVRMTAVLVPRPSGKSSAAIRILATSDSSTGSRRIDVATPKGTYRVIFTGSSASVRRLG